jgi:puromycin-sensitive aminopeptidase
MNKVRLPAHIKPERYDLRIKPDLEGFVFDGEETIYLNLSKSSRQIVLHAAEIQITEAVYIRNGSAIKPAKITYQTQNETATILFSNSLAKGKGALRLKFKGILNDKMRGFYRSSYVYQGKQKHLATTQFEATDARRAFPCFDEPSQKAIFDITLIVPSNLIAISNTLESEIFEHDSGFKTVKFKPTPKMSTYLVAFIVGDFESIEGITRDNVLVRVFVTPGKKHQAKFALDTAIKVLEFYNKYFDIQYPLPVMDLIAIPDFSHGAMENWGAVTYRETALLVDSEHSSAANKQWVALVIAHELAHQWFGNLVTMEWWTHLWLNEGFASYIEYLAVNQLFPSWDIWTQFAYNDLNIALKLDSLDSTHPIEVKVGHPDEISEIFDEISYSKGSSIIRMLADYLGEKDFRDGLRHYLKKHSYKNASTIHLWQAFEKVSKKPVRKMMANWTGKAGYPVLRIKEAGQKLSISQSRFFSSPISKKQSNDKTLWSIPVGIISASTSAKKILMEGRSTFIAKPKKGWLKFNSGETGFYRVDYPESILQALRHPVTAKSLPVIDRLGLVRDSFALAEAGDMTAVRAFGLISAYEKETDYSVWVEVASGMSQLKNLTQAEQFYPKLEAYSRSIFRDAGTKLGWAAKSGESHTATLLRSLLLSQMAILNDKDTIKQGKLIFKKSKVVPADIRSVVYQIVAQTGNSRVHQMFIEKYVNESLSEEKNRLGRALGYFKDKTLLHKTLDFAMSDKVRIQDTSAIFMGVWYNPQGKNLTWEYIKRHWSVLQKRYPATGPALSRLLKPASNFVTVTSAEDFKSFFKNHPAPGVERTIEQVLEKIYSNAAWLKRDGMRIAEWLDKNMGL